VISKPSHDLPADAPRAQRGSFPVVFFELDVVLAQVNTNCTQRFQIQFLYILRRRFQDHLQLHVLEQPVRIFTVATIGGTPRGLHISNLIRLRPKHPQKRFRSHGTRSHLYVIGLLQHTSALSPKCLQAQDEFLERQRVGGGQRHNVQSLLSALCFWLLAQNPRVRVVARTPTAQPETSGLIHDCNGCRRQPSACGAENVPFKSTPAESVKATLGCLAHAATDSSCGQRYAIRRP